jgi:hypothetical protein
VIDRTAFDTLSLAELEEASGELHRRIGVALRRAGEAKADDRDSEGLSPRRRVAAYAAMLEFTAATYAAIAASVEAPRGRYDQHPAAVVAIMYATPTIPALLSRLEQDRRLVASHARGLESRLDETHSTAWGEVTLRRLLLDAAIADAAQCALALERHAADLDAASGSAEV